LEIVTGLPVDIRTRRPLESVSSPDAVAQLTPKDVLEQLLPDADNIEDILIMCVDKDGQIGFLTNLDGLAESNLFIDRVKHRMLAQDASQGAAAGPKGIA
jgi:hypothetical protein